MSDSSMSLQTLLPGKTAERIPRNGTPSKTEQSFAALFEKRIQVRQDKAAAAVKPYENVDRQTDVKARRDEPKAFDKTDALEKSSKTEKTMAKNPAKEEMKKLMKKVRDTLEAMQDPEIAPEKLKELADTLKGLLVEIKTLTGDSSEAPTDEMPSSEPAEAVETASVPQNMVQVPNANGLKIGKSDEKLEAKAEGVHWDNRQASEIKANPLLNQLEKVLEIQSDTIEKAPDELGLKDALKEMLEELQTILAADATKPEAKVSDKLNELMAKLKVTEVKSGEVKANESEGTPKEAPELEVKASDETTAVIPSSETESANPNLQQDNQTPSGQSQADQNQQMYNAQVTTDSSNAEESGKTEKTVETKAAPVEQVSQTAPKQTNGPTVQPMQNPQAFQDTLDAIKNGVEAKTQFQSRIMEQVIESVKTNFKVDEMKSEMIMKLKPESLGNVSLKVSIEKGIVLAEFQVESLAVKQAMEASLQDLRTALQDKGLQLSQLDVSVRKDNQNQQQSGSNRGQQTRTARIEGNLDRMEQRLMSLESTHRESTIDYLG